MSKLTDADGEQLETQHWIETALDCSYLSDELASDLLQQSTSIGKMINSMINKYEQFCKPFAGNQYSAIYWTPFEVCEIPLSDDPKPLTVYLLPLTNPTDLRLPT